MNLPPPASPLSSWSLPPGRSAPCTSVLLEVRTGYAKSRQGEVGEPGGVGGGCTFLSKGTHTLCSSPPTSLHNAVSTSALLPKLGEAWNLQAEHLRTPMHLKPRFTNPPSAMSSHDRLLLSANADIGIAPRQSVWPRLYTKVADATRFKDRYKDQCRSLGLPAIVSSAFCRPLR